jgi:hypothetical protein
MMNCEKHLANTITNLILISIVLASAGCSKETRKKDFVARVNDSYLTREDFASLVDTTDLNSYQKEQIIENWIYNEILFQQAGKEGITEKDEYKRIILSSRKKLAGTMLIDEYVINEDPDVSDDELLTYYEKNKDYFKSTSYSYLIHKVIFVDEDKAIKFRSIAINKNWESAVNIFLSDSSIRKNYSFHLVEENNIYPFKLLRIIKDFYPLEISVVITEKAGYYSVVQLLKDFPAGSILPFEVIKSNIRKRYLSEKKNQIVKDYLKELYSQNEVEIKK